MGFDQVPRDRQADPRARFPTRRAASGHPVEALEDPLQLGCRKPLTGVGDPDDALVTFLATSDGDPAAGGGGADGVADQVGDHLGDPVGVRLNPHTVGRSAAQLDAGVIGLWTQPLDRTSNQLTQVDRLPVEAHPALLGARQRAQVGGQSVQPPGFRGDHGQALGRRRQHPVDHRLHLPVDDRQRGAHLVTHLAEQPDASRLGVCEALGHGAHIVHQFPELDSARLRQLGSVVARRNPGGGRADRGHRLQHPTSRQGSQQYGRHDPNHHPPQQCCLQRGQHLRPQRAQTDGDTPTVTWTASGHLTRPSAHGVEQAGGEQEDQHRGGDQGRNTHQHVRNHELDAEPAEGALHRDAVHRGLPGRNL